MKKEKEKIDELIREVLSEDEAAFYDSLEEKDLIGRLELVYRGKYGWLYLLITAIQLVLFILTIYCVVQFFSVEATQDLIKWGAGAFLGLMAVSLLKLFIWMQMDKNDILLELKKLELQLASHMEKTSH